MARCRAHPFSPLLFSHGALGPTWSIRRRTPWLVDAFRTAGGRRHVHPLRTGLGARGLQIRTRIGSRRNRTSNPTSGDAPFLKSRTVAVRRGAANPTAPPKFRESLPPQLTRMLSFGSANDTSEVAGPCGSEAFFGSNRPSAFAFSFSTVSALTQFTSCS